MDMVLTGGLLIGSTLAQPEIPPETQPTVETVSSKKEESDERFIKHSETDIELHVPFVHQYNDLPEDRRGEIQYTACGPTSLTIAFKYEGVETNLITVIDELPASVYTKGIGFYDLPSGAGLYNFEAVVIETSPQAFYDTLAEGHPIIINVQNYNGVIGHAMVVVGIIGFDREDNSAEALIVHDPTGGRKRIFEYDSETTLKQPGGYINIFGTGEPFYLKKKE